MTTVSRYQFALPRRPRVDPVMRMMVVATCIVVVFAVLWPSYLVAPILGVNFSATRLLVLFVLCLSVAACSLSPTAYQTTAALAQRFWRFYLLFGLLFVWRMVCNVSGITPAASTSLTLIEMVGIFAIFMPVALVSASGQARQVLALVIGLAALIVLLLGVYEAISGVNISARIVGSSSISAEIARQMMFTQVRDGIHRIKSVFGHPILLSQFAGLILPLFIHFALHGRKGLFRLMGLAGIVIAPYVILMTAARSGIVVALLAVAAYFAFTLLIRRRIRAANILTAIVAALLAVGAFSLLESAVRGLIQGRTAIEVSSANSRTIMIARGRDALEQSPIVGFGHGQSGLHAGLVGTNNVVTIDNYYLSAVLDFGVPGLLITLLLFFEIIIISTRSVAAASNARDRSLVAAFGSTAAVLGGLYVISSWDNLIILFIAAGFCMGAVVGADRRQTRAA